MAKLTIISSCCGTRLRRDGCNGPLILAKEDGDEPCCCGCSDPNIQYPCKVTVIHVDENRCEDDVFDIYVVGVNERFIRELDLVSNPPGCCNFSCPQTTIEFDINLQRDDFTEDCETTIEARFKRANCCNTLTRLTLVASNGAIITGAYFGQEGYSQTWEADVLCGATAPPP